MSWVSELKTTDSLMEIKNMAIERMKEVYPYSIQKGEICFSLPDGGVYAVLDVARRNRI